MRTTWFRLAAGAALAVPAAVAASLLASPPAGALTCSETEGYGCVNVVMTYQPWEPVGENLAATLSIIAPDAPVSIITCNGWTELVVQVAKPL